MYLFSRFPGDELLVETKLLSAVAPTEDLDEVVAFLNKVKDHFAVPRIHLKFIERLSTTGSHDLAMQLSNYALTMFSADLLYDVCIAEFSEEALLVCIYNAFSLIP
jgi:hypothetical protein